MAERMELEGAQGWKVRVDAFKALIMEGIELSWGCEKVRKVGMSKNSGAHSWMKQHGERNGQARGPSSGEPEPD
jgi:hypothetical protein